MKPTLSTPKKYPLIRWPGGLSEGKRSIGGVFQSQIHTESPLYSYGHFPNFIPKFWHLYFSKTKCGDFKVNEKYETCSTIPSPSF